MTVRPLSRVIRLACRLNTLEQTITKSLSISLLQTPFICVFLVGLHRINCCCQSAQFFCNWHSSAVYKDFLPVTCCQKPVRYHGLMPKQVSFHSNMRVVLVLLLIVSVIDLQKKNKLLLVLTCVVFSYGSFYSYAKLEHPIKSMIYCN